MKIFVRDCFKMMTQIFFGSEQEIQLILLPGKKSTYRGFLHKFCVKRDQNKLIHYSQCLIVNNVLFLGLSFLKP